MMGTVYPSLLGIGLIDNNLGSFFKSTCLNTQAQIFQWLEMDSRLSRLSPSPSPRDFTLQKAEFNGDHKTRSKPLKLNFLSIKI